MRGTAVLVAALALIAAPVGAQEYVWTADRPDGVAPVGIANDRALGAGVLEVLYRFARMEARGLKFGSAIFTEDEALDVFTFVPVERSAEAHNVTLAFGATDELTFSITGGWVDKTRLSADEEVFFLTGSSGLADLQADALWEVYASGPWRGHVQMGVIVPTGSIDEEGDFPASGDLGAVSGAQLPYDMQIGTGSVTLVPGIGAQVMNEYGSVGGQVRGFFAITDNDRGWRPGGRVDARGWLAYRFNDFVSASAGVRALAGHAIQGADPDLETLRDPGDLALSYATERVDLPVGLNLRMTEGPFAGHRIGIEGIWTVHEESDGPQLASDWGFVIGWQKEFGLGALGGAMPF
jgi:hypothetical protein